MLTVLVHVLLMLLAVQCLRPGAPVHSGALDVPWQDEVCCDSPTANAYIEEGTSQSDLNLPLSPRCKFRSSSAESKPLVSLGGTCLDILCRFDEPWSNLTCDLKFSGLSSGITKPSYLAVSLQQISLENDTEFHASEHKAVCDAEDSLMCSIHLNSTRIFAVRLTVNVSNVLAPPVLLRISPRSVKPSPPFNLSYIQTVEGDLIFRWKEPLDFSDNLLAYEIRYSHENTKKNTHKNWQVVSALEQPNVSLELKPLLKYTIQVRCTTQTQPVLWSDWSDPYHIYLNKVSYIPQKVVARAGDNVTVYCVLNGQSANANTAMWSLNQMVPLDPSLYHPVNQRVSQITFTASETGLYDLLTCTQEWNIPYSKIYVEGGFINITCVTNGDIDTMTCRWENKEWEIVKLRSKSAEMSCDEMEERVRGGEEVGEMGHECMPVKSTEKVCTFHPLKMNCYKLWLELHTRLGLIRCKPVYVSPINHVKPYPPTDVMAVSRSSGILRVTWKPPSLPVEGLQCQFRYYLLGVLEKWKFEKPVWVSWAEVEVPDMCQIYVVQVRCMHTSGIGYWSEWSESVHSTAQNSRAPERGPDFWRIRHDDPYRNQSNITLLFEYFSANWNTYCVDGFMVQHQALNGTVLRRQIDMVSSYSFEWNQELHIVTVEAYNILGSSVNNVNMTLEKQPKRRCVHSFHVLVINSTCVSLSWSLLHISSVPLFMVVQWFPRKQQDFEDFGLNGKTWVKLSYTEPPTQLRGDFFSSKEYAFHLYPVFADGEGEPVVTIVKTGNPPAYMMLMFISLICIAVFVTVVLSQNRMKKFVWKDVPNPNKCSWAKGLDFKTMDGFEYLFRPPEGLQASPLPPEKISKVTVVNKTLTKAFVQTPTLLSPPSVVASTNSFLPCLDPRTGQLLECETALGGDTSPDPLTTSQLTINKLQPANVLVEQSSGITNSSAQSSVTYSKVLHTDTNPDHPPLHLHYKEGSRSSYSDEGNFSANNSDTSETFPGGVWEVDSYRGTESDDPRRSYSYNSEKELSDASEQEDDVDVGQKKALHYLNIGHPPEDEENEEEESQIELLKSAHLIREDCSLELYPLLNPDELMDPKTLVQVSTCSFASLYMPQYRKPDVNHIPHT
ncbi:leptin receptor isoform X1 [Xiphophorus hellerii]|uniref:leptin receptor isoform X1 n=1 Tax=Xiphophorus hellerii TaxID=8084 RepID=UPI0013B42AE3|nr:leptin receptor isoform X1 [Xiphophorus hellerii]